MLTNVVGERFDPGRNLAGNIEFFRSCVCHIRSINSSLPFFFPNDDQLQLREAGCFHTN